RAAAASPAAAARCVELEIRTLLVFLRLVIAGLDPAIHPFTKDFCVEDGPARQARGGRQDMQREPRERNTHHDASLCEAASAAMRRSSKRCSLPVCVRGSWLTYSMVRGYL